MKGLLWFSAEIVLCVRLITCEVLSEHKCNFKDGFCDIDVETCLRPRRYADDLDYCDPVKYTKIYRDTTTSTKFSLDLVYPSDRSDLRYGLVSIDGETKSWRHVKECCNLKLNQTCDLRPIRHDEELELFATGGSYLCFDYISVHNADKDPWCETVEYKPPCLTLSNGRLEHRREFGDASISLMIIRSEYCFFSVPERIVSTNASNKRFIRNVPGMIILPLESERGETGHTKFIQRVNTGHNNVSCEIRSGITNHTKFMLDYELPPLHTLCFYVRVPGGSWKSTPDCMKRLHIPENLAGEVWKIALVALFALLVTLIVSVILRKRLRLCIPSYDDDKEEISKHITSVKECEEVLNSGETTGVLSKELPDEIQFLGLQNDATSKSCLHFENSCDDRLLENNDENPMKSTGSSPNLERMDSGCILEIMSDSRRSFSSCMKSEKTPEDGIESAIPGVWQNAVDYTEKDSIVTKPQGSDNVNVSHFNVTVTDGSTCSSTSDDSWGGNSIGCNGSSKQSNQPEHDISDYVKKRQLATDFA